MYFYYQKLHTLKGFLVGTEAVILFLRLIFQVLFTLPSALLVMQVLLAAIIYSRRHCGPEAQVYILINFFLLYCMGYNVIFQLFYSSSQPGPLVQNFKNSYKTYGYIAETLFRLTGIVAAWRCYQFSALIEQDEEDEPF